MDNVNELVYFNSACDDFISGKYLLIDFKIASILKILETNRKLREIINSCCENYSFTPNSINAEVTHEGAKLIIPTTEKEIVAFTYNLLSAFKNGTISINDFYSKFYPNLNINKFASELVSPFKDAVNNLYSKHHVLVETDEFQNNIYNKIKSTVKLIISNIDNFKLKMNEKEEFTLLLNSLYRAGEKSDKNLCYSLMVGLDYFSKFNKKTRSAYLSLEECFQ